MNLLCYNHLKYNETITEEQEEQIVDYLEDNGVEVDIDMNIKNMCQAVLSISPYIPRLETTEVTSNIPNYGKVNPDIYMKIAMEADRHTLNSMIRASGTSYYKKFNEAFFKRYLSKHYPLVISYKPINMSYRDYYLRLAYAIHKLYEEYDFTYFPSPVLDPVRLLETINTIERNGLPRWHIEKLLANEGLVAAAVIGDLLLIQEFANKGATQIDRAIKISNDPKTKEFLRGL